MEDGIRTEVGSRRAELSTLVNAILDAEFCSRAAYCCGEVCTQLVEKEYSKEHVVGLYKRLFDSMNKS